MTKKSIIFSIILLLICQLNCTAQKEQADSLKKNQKNSTDDIKVIDQTHNNTIIELRVDQNMIVDLPANPSTGYRWEIVEYNEDLLTLAGQEYKKREAAPGMVGVGGTDSFSFKALKVGQTRLVMRYARAHPNPEDTAEDFTVEINIK